MRTTLNLDDALIGKAQKVTGVMEKTRLLHLGLEALIQRRAAQTLAEMGGSDAKAQPGKRQRSTAR